jgi:hypothetical protein
MTTKAKKEEEERYARKFLDGHIAYTSIDPGERPDFWVRRGTAPDVALEVTRYHPEAQDVSGVRRREIESRWHDSLEPILDQGRRSVASLQEIRVFLGFQDQRLPRHEEHAALAQELVRLVEHVATLATPHGQTISVVWLDRAELANLPGQLGEMRLVAKEDWPETSKHLSFLKVSRWTGVGWPPWGCPAVDAAFASPTEVELRRVLDGKATKARDYELNGAPLWLLVVCESHGDLQSHIFPRNDEDLAQFAATLDEAGFDFQGGPFDEVWLLSAFTGARLRLYPSRQ